jgi:hypothetical protein
MVRSLGKTEGPNHSPVIVPAFEEWFFSSDIAPGQRGVGGEKI